jgi:hypothetical protein
MTPFKIIAAKRSGDPLTYSVFESGGNTGGNPIPVGWWHATQSVMYTVLPKSALSCPKLTNGVHAMIARTSFFI